MPLEMACAALSMSVAISALLSSASALLSSRSLALPLNDCSSLTDRSSARVSTLSMYALTDLPASLTRSREAISDLIWTCALLPALPIWFVTSLAALVTTGKCLRRCSKFVMAAWLTASSFLAFSSLSARAAESICAVSMSFCEDCRPTVSSSRAFCDKNSRASEISPLTARIRVASATLSIRNRIATLPKRAASRLLFRMARSHKTVISRVGTDQVVTNAIIRSLANPIFTSGQYVSAKNAVHVEKATSSKTGAI